MTRKSLFVSILTIALFSASCSSLWELSVESMAEKIRWQLKNRQFGKIYDEGSDFMRNNASREEFIERASKIVEELERIDPDIKWQPDDTLGRTYRAETRADGYYVLAYRKLENDKQKISIFVSWEIKDGNQKVSDISAFTSSDSERPFHLFTAGKLIKTK